MASVIPRARSNTSGSTASSRRPKSRASTTSVQSINTQPSHDTQHAPDTSFEFPDAHQPQESRYQHTAEDVLRQSIQQLKAPNSDFALDPALQDRTKPGQIHAPGAGYRPQALGHRPPLEHYRSFDGADSQLLDATMEDPGQDGTEPDGVKKKKGSASSIANDLELRRLFRENQGRSIKEVAAQVLTNERGPKSEKTKQIFAMLWYDIPRTCLLLVLTLNPRLNSVCKKSTGSVPRNRVFAHYATRCGTERVPPLNPASFGKLVRIIFPGIQTRRLGMRGESKYHYVDLSLEEDQQDVVDHERVHSAQHGRLSQALSGGRLVHAPARQVRNSVSSRRFFY